jgi:uncharacterized protein (DUF885 family)
MHKTALFGLLIACSLTAAAKDAEPTAARIATQNALFEEQYQADLKTHPERATAVGDYRYNDQLEDFSPAAYQRQEAADQSFLSRLNAISTAGFPEQDKLSHEVMQRSLMQRVTNFKFKEYEMPVNHMEGPQTRFADMPLAVPLDSVKHYEDYIARLHQIPRALDQSEEVLRAGMKDKLMPVRFLLEKVPAQCEGIIASDPFLLPTKKFPDSISAGDQQRLTKAITETVNNEVIPAYKKFAAFIAAEYAPQGRTTLSVTSLPGGKERYLNDIRSRTTISTLTPDQIHAIGLREIDRIEGEMLVIAQKEGFNDVASFRDSLKTNSKYIPTSSEQILDDFRKYIAQMQPKLPELFGYIPGSPVTVEAIPAFQASSATHYQTGTPKFRQHSGNSGYVEGWALYAEQLGKEVGFYQDPVSDYGRLSSELFRAVRLVVDTGLHSEGWSRDQVVEFFRKYQPVDEPTIQAETDRYIAWPAQALSYKLGQLKFRELRERAKKALGPKFDIRSFHDEMLNGGVLPLDLLDARTNSWIKDQKAGIKSAAN